MYIKLIDKSLNAIIFFQSILRELAVIRVRKQYYISKKHIRIVLTQTKVWVTRYGLFTSGTELSALQ